MVPKASQGAAMREPASGAPPPPVKNHSSILSLLQNSSSLHYPQGGSPPPAPVRDASSLKAVRYGPGHEKFPSWPAPAPTRSNATGGSSRSKSWTDQTHYPKEEPPVISRPYNKRINPNFSQQLRTVMERCEKIGPETYLPRLDCDTTREYNAPSPPERDVGLTQADLEEYARTYDPSYTQLETQLTQAELEQYSRAYDEASLRTVHQTQASYAQSEGYHSYVSSTDSTTNTPFLDRLRRESEAARVEGHESSASSGSSSETLKWHGSMSDVSSTGGASTTCPPLIAHSAKVQTPQRHHSESVLYLSQLVRNNQINNQRKLFPVSTYTVQPSDQLSPRSPPAMSVAERISELERQQAAPQQPRLPYPASYDIPQHRHVHPSHDNSRVTDHASLKAIQKKALLSFYERHHSTWKSEPQLSPPQPPPRPKPPPTTTTTSRRSSSASDYAASARREQKMGQISKEAPASGESDNLPVRHQHSSSCGSLSAAVSGPFIMGPAISIDDWVPARPPKKPHLRAAYPVPRMSSPDLPPPSPPPVVEDEVFVSDEPLPPPPTEDQLPDLKSLISSHPRSQEPKLQYLNKPYLDSSNSSSTASTDSIARSYHSGSPKSYIPERSKPEPQYENQPELRRCSKVRESCRASFMTIRDKDKDLERHCERKVREESHLSNLSKNRAIYQRQKSLETYFKNTSLKEDCSIRDDQIPVGPRINLDRRSIETLFPAKSEISLKNYEDMQPSSLESNITFLENNSQGLNKPGPQTPVDKKHSSLQLKPFGGGVPTANPLRALDSNSSFRHLQSQFIRSASVRRDLHSSQSNEEKSVSKSPFQPSSERKSLRYSTTQKFLVNSKKTANPVVAQNGRLSPPSKIQHHLSTKTILTSSNKLLPSRYNPDHSSISLSPSESSGQVKQLPHCLPAQCPPTSLQFYICRCIFADCVHVQLYRDSKDRYNNGQTKASLSLQYFLAVQSGFTLDKESNTIAILCEDVAVVFAFDTREQLIQWQAKIAINLGEDDQFVVQICSTPGRSKLVPGPARLHMLEGRFCLTDGVPPRLLGHWNIAHLRKYGVIDSRFCFEGGSQCGRGEGVHVLLTDQAEALSRAFQTAAARGNTPLARRAPFSYMHGRERSISSSRTEANICDKRCSDSLLLGDRDCRSRSQENLCWTSPGDWVGDLSSSGDLLDFSPREGALSRPRCRSCHVKLSRSSTVTCAPGSGFTWTMESCGGMMRSPTSSLEHRHQSASSTVRSVVESPGLGCPPPRPPKTKLSSLGETNTFSKRPRPSPSMPLISTRCACGSSRLVGKDISSTPITEMGEEYYDTPRSFKNAIFDHSVRPSSSCSCCQGCCLRRCETTITHAASVNQVHYGHDGKENVSLCHHNQTDHSFNDCPFTRSHSVQTEDELTRLSSDPSWRERFSQRADVHSNCCCYMNVKANTLCQAKRCVKSVTFSDLPLSAQQQQPNYVNIDFAESLKFYENCKDCYNKLLDDLESDQERNLNPKRTKQNSCSCYCDCVRDLSVQVNSTQFDLSMSRPVPDESPPGYIKMSSLANISANDNVSSCIHGIQKHAQPFARLRSNSSLCLNSSHKSHKSFHIKSISDPEINLLPTSRKRSKIALSKIIDVIRNVRPLTGQEIQRHARKPSLPSYKNRTEETQYQSDDTLSSDTMVNTANDMSVKGSLNSLCSETNHQVTANRFLSASELNISLASLDHFKSTKREGKSQSELEKYKDHLRNLELPQLPSDLEYCRHDNTCLSAVRRSCTLTFKPGHNRDSSSSNDSGVSTASLRMRRTDFTEFEMPVTTSLSAKLLREYALSQGKSSSDLSLPRRSKSIDPLGELVFLFQDSSNSAKSTSALLSVVDGKEGKLLRFIDAPSTSSGTSDLSDYMDNLSISSYSSNDHPRMSRCPATTLKPRSGKEYHKIDRLNLKPTEEGSSRSTEPQQSV